MRYSLVVDIGASSGRHILGHLENGIYGASRDMDETFGLIETVEKAASFICLLLIYPTLTQFVMMN